MAFNFCERIFSRIVKISASVVRINHFGVEATPNILVLFMPSSFAGLQGALFSYLFITVTIGDVIVCCPLSLHLASMSCSTRTRLRTASWFNLMSVQYRTTPKTVFMFTNGSCGKSKCVCCRLLRC